MEGKILISRNDQYIDTRLSHIDSAATTIQRLVDEGRQLKDLRPYLPGAYHDIDLSMYMVNEAGDVELDPASVKAMEDSVSLFASTETEKKIYEDLQNFVRIANTYKITDFAYVLSRKEAGKYELNVEQVRRCLSRGHGY
jgi:hypothetical protein